MPSSTMRPPCRTAMRSALRTVETRCEMKIVVRPLHHVAQVVENFVFGVGVDAGERVVENQNLRIANQGAGDGSALLLSAGERDAALADHGVVAFGKALDVGRDVGGFGGVVNLLVGGRVDAKRDVLADAVAEQESFLRDESDVACAASSEYSRIGRPSIRTMPGSAS